MFSRAFKKVNADLNYGYVIVGAAAVIFIISFGVHYSFGVFFKPMSSEFGWSRSLTSGAFSLSWIIHGVSAIWLGRVNDRYGPRRVLILSGSLLAGGYILTTMVREAWHFYLTYGVLVGIGTGGMYIPLISTVARWFVRKRTSMTGIAVAGAGLGTFVIPLVANRLIAVFDWRTTYIILGVAVLFIVLSASLTLKRDPSQIGRLPYGAEPADGVHIHQDRIGLTLRQALRTRQFWMICAIYFCFGFFTFAFLVHIAPHATDLGMSSATAANFVAAIGIASIIGKVFLGQLGDRIGNRNIYTICFLAVSLAITFTQLIAWPWLLFPFVVVIGLAYGGCSASHSPLIATFFGLKAHGQIIGAANNGYTIGATIGPLAAGYFFDRTGSYQISFYVVALVAGIGLILTLFLKPDRSTCA